MATEKTKCICAACLAKKNVKCICIDCTKVESEIGSCDKCRQYGDCDICGGLMVPADTVKTLRNAKEVFALIEKILDDLQCKESHESIAENIWTYLMNGQYGNAY